MAISLSNKKGFTLIEALLSVALIGLILGIGTPIFQSLQIRNDLDLEVRHYASSLRKSQILAEGSDGDSTWGVKVQQGSITLFKGSSYAARDTAFDETTSFPSTITISGLNEITFAKMTGLPFSTGTTTFTSSNGEVRHVTINTKGSLSF